MTDTPTAAQILADYRNTQAALAASELRYRRLFETAQDGILIIDATTGCVIDANPFMTKLLNYPLQHFLGKELWELGLFADAASCRENFETLLRDGYVRYEHLPLSRESGSPIAVEFVSNVYQVADAKIIQCNIRDISARRVTEEQEHNHLTALAELDRRKNEFLTMLSHELRNPLAPILNAVHLLATQGGETPVQKQARQIIERQVGQLKRLVDDLLEVSRLNTGRLELRRENISLNAVVSLAAETVRPLMEARQHKFTVSVPERELWVNADAVRLQQVLLNLLMNAYKYTDVGGQISVTLDGASDEGVVRVRDTGRGISAELLPRIFDLFAQAEQTLDRAEGGLGVGLTVVRRLMELHGGTATVTSTPGQGSEFVVRMPLTVLSAPGPELFPPVVVEPAFRSVRVLVVDDNVDAAECLALLLRIAGHEVSVAATGPTALSSAIEAKPEMVFLDIGLPGMDGFEVAERIRAEPTLSRTVLAALSGYGQPEDRQRARTAGFNHYLVKPVPFAEIEQLVETVGRAGAAA